MWVSTKNGRKMFFKKSEKKNANFIYWIFQMDVANIRIKSINQIFKDNPQFQPCSSKSFLSMIGKEQLLTYLHIRTWLVSIQLIKFLVFLKKYPTQK